MSDLITRLVEMADLEYETAREWYASYTCEICDDQCRSLPMQAVEYDWLNDDDATVVERLTAAHDWITASDAEYLAAAARGTRDAAEEIEGHLWDAVAAYRRDDLDGVLAALASAADTERQYGGYSPATDTLRSQLTEEVESRLVEIEDTLGGYGDTYTGEHVDETAVLWGDEGFDAANVEAWCDARCWDATTAAILRDEGISPEEARAACERLDAAHEGPWSGAMYAACNGDMDVQAIIDAARSDD